MSVTFVFIVWIFQLIVQKFFVYIHLQEQRWKASATITLLSINLLIELFFSSFSYFHTALSVIQFFVPIKTYIAMFLQLCFLLVLYKDKLSKKLLVFLFSWVIMLGSDAISATVFNALTGLPLEEMRNSFGNINLLICNILFLIVQLVLTYILSLFLNRKTIKQNSAEIIPGIVIIFIQFFLFYTSIIRNGGEYSLAFIVFILIALILCILADFYILVIAPPKAAETRILQEKLACMQEIKSGEKEFFSTLLQKEREMALLRHDWNNILQVALATLEKAPSSKQMEESEKLLQSLAKRVNNTRATRYSKNELINVLLNAKAKTLEENNIPFTVSCSLPERTKMDPMDLCSLLSNLIDNAIEHCIANPNPKNFVRISVKSPSEENFIVRIENYAKINGKSFPKTTKTNGELHGLGMEIIRAIATKYEGTFDFKYSDSQATATVFLINQQLS